MTGTDEILFEGTITAIRRQKKDPDRVSIDLDGEFAFGIHIDILLAENLAQGDHVSEVDSRRLQSADNLFRARAVALRYLSYRQRSRGEVERKLREKEFSETVTVQVLERLTDLGMLDDESFALEYALARLRNRQYGKRRLRSELRRKHVHEHVVDAVLANVFSEVNSAELAANAARKIFNRLSREPDTRARRKKLSDYLSRRGFNFDEMELAFERLDNFINEQPATRGPD